MTSTIEMTVEDIASTLKIPSGIVKISSGAFYDTSAFDFNFQSGEISPNPDFHGVNVLFDLPLDKAKADPEKVQRFLDERYNGDYKENFEQPVLRKESR
ncbi:hypothetical protein SAMN05446037_1003174 [Anaerovirgula multivorans]|uniref:Uncharacterized protein n=1 Tax=Anaerovirgula multivorans TaxID=312168 RepID=A0A239BDY8_9FIRM|nr:hypothetical protein [Anaerovirgula multivorans]SNS05618.1 hypothetical protein SAMN05446037_1003174 [Anaerovirgula multivorans]